MNRFTTIIFLTVFIAIIGYGICFSTEPVEDYAQSVNPILYRYFPFKTDDWLQYDRSYWSIPHGYAWVEEITSTVMGTDRVLDGRLAFIIKDTGVSYDSIWYVFMDDEVRRYEDYPHDYSDYRVMLKLPIRAGQRWAYRPFPENRDTSYAFILSTSDTVDVSAGTYTHCIHIYGDLYQHAWYAPGLGLIKSSEAEGDSLTGTDNDLMNYDIEGVK